MISYRSCSLRTRSGRAQRPCSRVRQPRCLGGTSVRRRLPSPSQRVVRRWMCMIARSSRGRWRQEHAAGGTAPPSPQWCRLGGERGIGGVFLAGALGKSPHHAVLPPFLSQLLEELLSCGRVGAASSVGPLLQDCSGRSGGGNLLQSGFCRQMQGFFPLPKACLCCFPKLSMQICKRSSPVPQNKLGEICQ